MEKKTKKNKKDVEDWILSFERSVGKPVVLQLLVQNQSIDFVSLIDKQRWQKIESDDDGDDSEPDVDLNSLKDKVTKFEMGDYIG